jgi:hypothetical protein
MLSEILKEFHTYYKTKHPKSKISILKATKTVLQEYLSFAEEKLVPKYGLENIKILLVESPTQAILICQKLPNTGILWTLHTIHYPLYQIPNTLMRISDSLPNLKKTIEKDKTIMDTMDSLSPENDDNNKWTDVKVWQHLLYTTIVYTGQQAINAYHFIEDVILERKEHITIPPYIYGPALSEILAQKLTEHTNLVAYFAEVGEHLIPTCNIFGDPHITLLFPSIPTKKQVYVNLKKIDKFNRTTNEYLKKVYNRIKTTAKTFLIVKTFLQ